MSEISDYIGEALRDTKDGYVRGILLSLASVFIPSRNAPFRDETKPAVSHPRRTRGSQSSREKSRRDESFSSTGTRTPGYRL